MSPTSRAALGSAETTIRRSNEARKLAPRPASTSARVGLPKSSRSEPRAERAHSTSRAAASTPATAPSGRTENPVDSSGSSRRQSRPPTQTQRPLMPAHAAVGAHAHDLDVARLARAHAAADEALRGRADERGRALDVEQGIRRHVDLQRAAVAARARTRDQRPSASSDASPATLRSGRGVPTEPSKASARPAPLARVSQREWPAGRPSSSNVCSWRTARRVAAGPSAELAPHDQRRAGAGPRTARRAS